MAGLGHGGVGGFAVEEIDVGAEVGAGGAGADFAGGPGFADLGEDPGIADGAAADHEAVGAGGGDECAGGGEIADVAVGEDGAGHEAGGAGDGVVVQERLVHLAHGASVDGEGVDGVAAEEVEQRGELVGGVEADAGLDGEAEVHGVADVAQDDVDFLGVAEQAAAGVLAADDGRGAAEVEVDAGDGALLQIAGGAGGARRCPGRSFAR